FQPIYMPGSRGYGPPKVQDTINELLQTDRGVPGEVLGIDTVRPDPADMDWVIACSFKPAELAKQERMYSFFALQGLKNRKIHGHWREFSEAGMSDYDPGEYSTDVDLSKFEVITFTTMLNQIDYDQIEPMRRLARSYLADNGIIIYQDRFMPDPNDSSRLKFLPNYNGYNYRTLIEFGQDENHTLFDLMQWETGRCKVMRRGPAFAAILGRSLDQQFAD